MLILFVEEEGGTGEARWAEIDSVNDEVDKELLWRSELERRSPNLGLKEACLQRFYNIELTYTFAPEKKNRN